MNYLESIHSVDWTWLFSQGALPVWDLKGRIIFISLMAVHCIIRFFVPLTKEIIYESVKLKGLVYN